MKSQSTAYVLAAGPAPAQAAPLAPRLAALLAGALLFLSGCGGGSGADQRPQDPVPQDVEASRGAEPPRDSAGALSRALTQIDRRMAAVDSLFQPLPLLRPAQEAALRQFPYSEQLARSRELGVGRGLSAERIRALRRQGRLIPLEDTTHWTVRKLNYSEPLVVPALRAALVRIGRRFQARLTGLGAPPFRMEVSSAL